MLKLHVWGVDSQVSIISPECVASSWTIINQLSSGYEIITSCNTNISDVYKLPVLIDDESGDKYHGFEEIANFIDDLNFKKSRRLIISSKQDMDVSERLINGGLIHQLISKMEYISQYNLFINNRNYEGYVRKLFQHYLPFPMMYNQPLKFYNQAQVQVQLIGLNRGKVGFFNLTGVPEVAETEYFNANNDEEEGAEGIRIVEENNEVEIKPLSGLHERSLINKSKEKSMLQESNNSLKCMNLLNSYLDVFVKTYETNHRRDEKHKFGYIFNDRNDKFSSSEVLLYAYLYSLTSSELPDRFINNYLGLKHPQVLGFAQSSIDKLSKTKGNFRSPKGDEIPSLWNEIKYWTRLVEY